MKDEKAKYLIIDSTEINKQLYKVTREAAFNDFYNVYKPNGMMPANNIFEKNGIPEEFRKIIVKINIPFCLKKEAEEYTMGFPFDITGGKIEKENNKRIISASSGLTYDYYANQQFRDKIKFKTELTYSTFDDVMNFLLKVDDEGYLKLYFQSIKEFFDISIDLDLVEESWIESKQNAKQAIIALKSDLPVDIIAINIKEILENLGKITGETVSEDIIKEIFAKFCLGK